MVYEEKEVVMWRLIAWLTSAIADCVLLAAACGWHL